MKRICGFFIIFLFSFNFLFAKERLSLQPIIVKKEKSNLRFLREDLKFHSLFEVLDILPIDLQSRALKGDIQTDFSLRGSNFSSVLILLDGLRINDPQTAHHNSDLPITKEDLQIIEIIPATNSSSFGLDAIGGAINFITKKPKEKALVLESSYGSFKTKSGIFSFSQKIKDFGLRVSSEVIESDGFQYDTDFKKYTTTFYSSLDIPDGEFNLNLGYQEKAFGAYDFYTPGLDYPSFEWTKTYLLNTHFILNKEAFLIKPNFLWRRHFDKFMLDKTQRRSKYLNHHYTDIYLPCLYLQKETEFFGRLGLGLEYGKEDIHSTNLGKHKRHHKSIFLDNFKALSPKFFLDLSFRIDDYDKFIYTGSLNFKYKFSDKNAFCFGLSKNVRIPSFTELYYNDPVNQGNAFLSEEKAINYEIGYHYKKEALSSGVVFFFREEKDMIDWVSVISVPPGKWQVKNIGEAKVKGVENYFKLKINEYLTLDSCYTYVDKDLDEKGFIYKYGPNYSKHLFNATLIFNLIFGIQSINLTYKKKPAQKDWFLLNTNFSYKLNKNTQLFLKITNLLNVKYEEIKGIMQPKRWIEAGLRFSW